MKKFVLSFFLITLSFAGIKEDFFHTGLSAKALALGGTAFGFGVDSVYSNPAGLAVIPDEYYGYSYKTSFENMLDTMTFEYMRPHKRGAWGIGLIHMNNSDADKTVINEFDRPDVVGKFSERQIGLSGAYAIPIWGDSAVGIGARYYRNDIDGEFGQSLGFFAGYIKRLKRNLLYGLSVNNFSILSNRPLSTPITWSTSHTDYFPLRISNSLAYRRSIYGFQAEFFGDIHWQEVNEDGRMDLFYSLGSMVWIVPKLFNIRAGLNDENLSLGLGVRLAGAWGIDYAYLSHEYLGGSHFISISYKPGVVEKLQVNSGKQIELVFPELSVAESDSDVNIEKLIKTETTEKIETKEITKILPEIEPQIEPQAENIQSLEEDTKPDSSVENVNEEQGL